MRLTLRDLEPADEPRVLRLFAECDDWFQAATGHLSGPGDVQSLYYSLPEGADFEQKRLLVAEAQGGMIGFVDLLLHYPDERSAAIGCFLVPRELRRWGIGTEIANQLKKKYPDITRVTASITDDWKPGTEFLKKQGFQLDGKRAVLEIAPRSDGR
ncbi:GNAT family N-acetyltransferase [Lentzea sp. NBRC 105346]|uniref:GNAT family N-acetyltransferase n=1 Tax=Lentzea sp. NBRC 105346 TaxID=3032205 RepID=UPI0025539ABE|nr:GNAT family N-acetyltransferase [Lentzea sp. NBRC 105346]